MSAKAEKRLAQKALKLDKTLKKTARQFANPTSAKSIGALPAVTSDKVIPPLHVQPSHRLMRWTRELEDDEGGWSWGELRAVGAAWGTTVHPFLQQCIQRHWYEIDADRVGKGRKRRKKHCFYQFGQIVEEAQLRLVELKLDDFAEQIFRFRITGLQRLYGFRREHIFFFLWYDPKHKIYPVN